MLVDLKFISKAFSKRMSTLIISQVFGSRWWWYKQSTTCSKVLFFGLRVTVVALTCECLWLLCVAFEVDTCMYMNRFVTVVNFIVNDYLNGNSNKKNNKNINSTIKYTYSYIHVHNACTKLRLPTVETRENKKTTTSYRNYKQKNNNNLFITITNNNFIK